MRASQPRASQPRVARARASPVLTPTCSRTRPRTRLCRSAEADSFGAGVAERILGAPYVSATLRRKGMRSGAVKVAAFAAARRATICSSERGYRLEVALYTLEEGPSASDAAHEGVGCHPRRGCC